MTGGSRNAAEQRAEQRAAAAERLAPFRFKPGQSGNPRGARGRARTLEEIFDRVLRERKVHADDLGVPLTRRLERREIIARVIVAAAEKGDTESQRILLDRLWPKPAKLELEIPGDTLRAAEDALDRRIERQIAQRMNGEHAADPAGA